MKRNQILLAGALAAVLTFTGCQSNAGDGESVIFTPPVTEASTEAPEESSTAAVENPIRQVQGIEDFASLQAALGVPEGAQNVEYYIIADEVAEVNFVLDGNHFSFRGAAGDQDISGVYDNFQGQALTVSGADTTAEIQKTSGGGRLALWTDTTSTYSLYTAAEVEDEAIQKLIEELIAITEAGGANPRKQVENREGLSALGVRIAEPDDAKDSAYYIVGENTAEIRFTWNDAAYQFRGASGSVDAGVSEEWNPEMEILEAEYDDGTLEITRQKAENGARLATWKSGDFAYSLYTNGEVSDSDFEKICREAADTTK